MKSYWPFWFILMLAALVLVLHPDQVAADITDLTTVRCFIFTGVAVGGIVGSGALLINYGAHFHKSTSIVRRIATFIYDLFFFNIYEHFQRLKIPLHLYFILWVCYMYLIINGKRHFRWHVH